MYYLILLIFTIFLFCNNKLLAQAQNLTELGENWTKNIINNNENSTSFCEMVYYISDQQKNISLYSISPEEFISLSNTFYSFNLSNEDITNIITSAINFKNTSQGSIYNNLSVIDTIIKIISEDQPNLELLINLSNLKDVSKNILRFINSEKFNNVYNQKKLENQANKDYWNMAFDYYFLINKEITRIHNDKNIYDSLSQDKSSIFAPNIQANELCIYLVNSLTHNKKSLTLEDFQTIPNYTEWLKVNLNINQQSNSTKGLKNKMLNFIKYLSKILISIIIVSNLHAANSITVGASNIPHSEILDFVKPILKKQGIDLNIVIFQDYILPNKALAGKEIDANYFQHIQYLDSQIKENRNYKFKILAKVHIEPIGLYSKKYTKISDLPQNAKIVTSNSSSDLTRILLLLQSSGLITLKPNQSSYTLNDIITNPKNIQILNSIDSSLLALMYKENEQDAIVINTNYALDAGLNPLKDAIVLESADSPYVNILVSREDNAKDKNLQQLAKVLNSKEVQDFIKNKYNGNVLPYKN